MFLLWVQLFLIELKVVDFHLNILRQHHCCTKNMMFLLQVVLSKIILSQSHTGWCPSPVVLCLDSQSVTRSANITATPCVWVWRRRKEKKRKEKATLVPLRTDMMVTRRIALRAARPPWRAFCLGWLRGGWKAWECMMDGPVKHQQLRRTWWLILTRGKKNPNKKPSSPPQRMDKY